MGSALFVPDKDKLEWSVVQSIEDIKDRATRQSEYGFHTGFLQAVN
jgi:hypothetical protein